MDGWYTDPALTGTCYTTMTKNPRRCSRTHPNTEYGKILVMGLQNINDHCEWPVLNTGLQWEKGFCEDPEK